MLSFVVTLGGCVPGDGVLVDVASDGGGADFCRPHPIGSRVAMPSQTEKKIDRGKRRLNRSSCRSFVNVIDGSVVIQQGSKHRRNDHGSQQSQFLERFHFSCELLEKGLGPNGAKHPSGRLRLLGPDPFSSCILTTQSLFPSPGFYRMNEGWILLLLERHLIHSGLE